MKRENGRIVEATEDELRDYYLSKEFNEVIPYSKFLERMRQSGCVILEGDRYRKRLVELMFAFQKECGGPVPDKVGLAEFLLKNGVTVKVKKEKPHVNLDGKCGSCVFSAPAEGVFGKGKCYVRCYCPEHLNFRKYKDHPLMAVRQRTTKACKKYQQKDENVVDSSSKK